MPDVENKIIILYNERNSDLSSYKILKNPKGERFVEIAALLLSRNNAPKEIFDRYLDKTIFVQQWARIKRQMRKNTWNDPRIIFWQAVYKKLAFEFKEKGVSIRLTRQEEKIDTLSQGIAEKIKTCRQDLDLTQNELAQKIGISQQIISRIEKGHNDMRLLTLEKIAQGLGKEVSIELT